MNKPSFNIDQGEAAIGADGQALERLAQYFLRAPMSDDRPMPAKELLQSHFTLACSKFEFSFKKL